MGGCVRTMVRPGCMPARMASTCVLVNGTWLLQEIRSCIRGNNDKYNDNIWVLKTACATQCMHKYDLDSRFIYRLDVTVAQTV